MNLTFCYLRKIFFFNCKKKDHLQVEILLVFSFFLLFYITSIL